jgi:hypothetical protein
MARSPQSLAELYAEHQRVKAEAKALYDRADKLLSKLVRTWKKNRTAEVEPGKRLEIEDKFRGQVKAFAPGFAHRYDLKLKTVDPA